MYAVAGSGLRDLWYAGGAGTVLHWDGVRWAQHLLPEPVDVTSAWSTRSGEVWVSGVEYTKKRSRFRTYRITADGKVEERTSKKGFGRGGFGMGVSGFPVVATSAVGGTVYALGGGSALEIVEIGPDGEERYRGPSSSLPRLTRGRAIHAFAADDIWVAGYGGLLAHWNGTRWADAGEGAEDREPFDPDLHYEGVWGAAPDVLWAVAIPGKAAMVDGEWQHPPVFVHYDGRAWRVAERPRTACGDIRTIESRPWWEAEPAPKFLDGPGAARVLGRRPFDRALVGNGRNQVVFKTSGTCVFFYDGERWRAEPRSATRGEVLLNDELAPVAALGDGTFVVGNHRFAPEQPATTPTADGSFNSNRFDPLLRQQPSSIDRLALDGAGLLWSMRVGLATWTSDRWKPFNLPASTGITSTGSRFFVRNRSDVWAQPFRDFGLPDDSLRHWDGKAWTRIGLGARWSGTNRELVGNADAVWALDTSSIRRIDASGAVHTTPLPTTQAFRADLLVDPRDPEKVWFLLAIATSEHGNCLIGYVRGDAEAQVEATIPRCLLAQKDWPYKYTSELRVRLRSLEDGRIAVVTSELLATWDGTTAIRQFEGPLHLRDLAPLGGGRHWLATRDGLELWNAKTNERTLARPVSSMATVITGANGELWAGAASADGNGSGGLLHFAPEPQRPKPPR
jgi:hypothetical protein